MEILPRVDENDNQIGTVEKRQAHRESIKHRVSGMLVFKDETRTQVLLQLRSKQKKQSGGKWGLTAGHVLDGESYEQAMEREYKEELFNGRDIEIKFSSLFKINKDTDNCNAFFHLFEGIYDGDFYIQEEEVERVEFFDIEFLKKDIFENSDKYTGSSVKILRKYFDI